MVKLDSTNILSARKKYDKVVVIGERPSKPPGNSKFNRTSASVPTTLKNQESKFEGSSSSELCQELLIQGYVQSYVDFYHLIHRWDPLAREEITTTINLPYEEMIFIRDNLVKAELSRRQGDTSQVYASYNKLADYYVSHKDWKTGFFFHEKCLEVAQLTNDIRAEMAANHSLGIINQQMLNYERARFHHEKHEELAISIDVFEEIAKANTELYKVYLTLAENMESKGELDDALEIYHLCLQAAKKSWDKFSEAEANGRIGNLLLNRGDIQLCISYLKEQSQLAADLGHPESRCRACSSLALAWDKLGQSEKALNELTLVHAISEQAGDAFLQAQACRALGTLYSKLGRLDAAVDILQRHFNLLKSILYRTNTTKEKVDPDKSVSSSDLDLARAFIGISRGNQLLGYYATALQFNFPSLLNWKLNRTDLSKPVKTLESVELQQDSNSVRMDDESVDSHK